VIGDLIVEVAHGPQRGQKAVVRPGRRLAVGSGADVDWSLADSGLAAQQLALEWDGVAGTLRHLGGDISTCLEGQAVDHGPVRHGTWIRAGGLDLTVACERHTPPEAPPSAATISAAVPALARLTTVADPLYAIVDASRSPRIRVLLRESPAVARCLYDGVEADSLAESAPYLVPLEPAGLLLPDLVHEGWRRRWSTFLTAPRAHTPDEVRRHLRKFLRVQLERTGEIAYFRFYDPYVLRTYVAGCTADERRAFVGPLTYLPIDDDGVVHVLTA
jgi:hypothetical protein